MSFAPGAGRDVPVVTRYSEAVRKAREGFWT